MTDDIDTEEPKPKMCERCGAHPDDMKCLDEHIGDTLRPMQTKLCRMLNDETIPHAVLGGILDAADALSRAMQAAKDCMPNEQVEARL
jgi:hypothetical protein